MDADLNLTQTGRGLGTPHFMAPEQFRNAKNADVRCDIYSLGATLYMMVTGELPFADFDGPLDAWMKKIQNDLTPPRKIVPDLSERRGLGDPPGDERRADHRPTQLPRVRRGPDRPQHAARADRPTTRRHGRRSCGIWSTRTRTGEQHTVKGSTAAIRRSLKEGLLGDAANVRASRTKAGPFEPLQAYPEFRDLVLAATLPGDDPTDASPATPPAWCARRPHPVHSPRGHAAAGPGRGRRPGGGRRADDRAGAPRKRTPVWMECLKWLALFAIAVVSAVLAFHFIPENWFRP